MKNLILLGIMVLTGLPLLSSCASLPLPDNPDQSLVIIPFTGVMEGEKDRENGHGRTESLKLELFRVDDYQKISFLLNPALQYGAVALDPGRYSLSTLVMSRRWYNSSGATSYIWEEKRPIGQRSLLVKERTALIYPSWLKFSETRGSFGYKAVFEDVAPKDWFIRRLAGKITSNSRWLAWEGYQQVGFPESPQ